MTSPSGSTRAMPAAKVQQGVETFSQGLASLPLTETKTRAIAAWAETTAPRNTIEKRTTQRTQARCILQIPFAARTWNRGDGTLAAGGPSSSDGRECGRRRLEAAGGRQADSAKTYCRATIVIVPVVLVPLPSIALFPQVFA